MESEARTAALAREGASETRRVLLRLPSTRPSSLRMRNGYGGRQYVLASWETGLCHLFRRFEDQVRFAGKFI